MGTPRNPHQTHTLSRTLIHPLETTPEALMFLPDNPKRILMFPINVLKAPLPPRVNLSIPTQTPSIIQLERRHA